MLSYALPQAVEIAGRSHAIRSDYRVILDILTALRDPALRRAQQLTVCLEAFYPDFPAIPPEQYPQAIAACFRFIDQGQRPPRGGPRLMDWEQDFPHIVAPVNRTLGLEIRALPYLHWYTFLAAYYEIGDCLFAQIVRIRGKQARGQALDPGEKAWYRRNRALVELKTRRTAQDEAFFAQVLGLDTNKHPSSNRSTESG